MSQHFKRHTKINLTYSTYRPEFLAQIQKSEFDPQHYQIFWEVVSLERVLLSHVSTTGELLERKSRDSGLENGEYGHTDPSHWPYGNIYQQKLALTSPTSCCRSVGIVRSRTQATEFVLFVCFLVSLSQEGLRSVAYTDRLILPWMIRVLSHVVLYTLHPN
jgi:hypothetical protein